ncbi:hypothetical protein RHECNPAF_33400114 [Rhizobium etli CNPAF512]|nr:hypothetical protein RHECNPAF_33400114 [Rhizobium etli CNPAF512]
MATFVRLADKIGSSRSLSPSALHHQHCCIAQIDIHHPQEYGRTYPSKRLSPPPISRSTGSTTLLLPVVDRVYKPDGSPPPSGFLVSGISLKISLFDCARHTAVADCRRAQAGARSVDEGPGRRGFPPENAGVVLIDPGKIEGPRHLRGEVGESGARAVDHGDREGAGDVLPLLPFVKGLQAVGAHDPDEIDMRIAGLDARQRTGGVADAERLFEGGDLDARIGSHTLAFGNAFGQRCELVAVLQRIARGYHPPELVEAEALDGDLCDKRVALMRRIERTAEQADDHAAFAVRHAEVAPIQIFRRHVKVGSVRHRAPGI